MGEFVIQFGSLSVEKTNVERRGVRDKLREDRMVKPSWAKIRRMEISFRETGVKMA